jgi:hypothetical protein
MAVSGIVVDEVASVKVIKLCPGDPIAERMPTVCFKITVLLLVVIIELKMIALGVYRDSDNTIAELQLHNSKMVIHNRQGGYIAKLKSVLIFCFVEQCNKTDLEITLVSIKSILYL